MKTAISNLQFIVFNHQQSRWKNIESSFYYCFINSVYALTDTNKLHIELLEITNVLAMNTIFEKEIK